MKKLLLLLARPVFLGATCVLLLDTSSFAQEIEWQNTIGGSGNDRLYSIQQTTDGGYILGGYSNSNISGDKTENCCGIAHDYWIIKLNEIGIIQWQNTIAGSSGDELDAIQQTTDGGFILGGTSLSPISCDKTENQIGGYDYWIVKTDSIGNVQWENTIAGSSSDRFSSIKQTADGGYILGGYSQSGISGDKTENCLGGLDYWIVKIDASGNIQWQNTIGGSSNDYLYSIEQTTDGGYILGGHSSSNISGDKTENFIGGTDYWIVKTDPIGNIQWQNTIGGNEGDELHSIQQTSDGGYILGGWSESNISGDKTENNMGISHSQDYWILKTDSSGNIQWQNTIGGDFDDELYSIQQTVDGGYILGGTSGSSISGDKTENPSADDYWVIKIDVSGNIQWQNTIRGGGWDELHSIQQTTDGGYILGGYSDSNILHDKTENCIGSDDYWIVKLTGSYNLITGKLFIDPNSNSVQDAGEPSVINNMVYELNTGHFGFSQNAGVYYVSVLDSGNFIAQPNGINYYNAVPATHNAYFSGIQQTDSLNDFAFQPAGVFNDLCANITLLGHFGAGMNATYMLNYENVGTTTINNCSVIFFPDNDITYVSSNVTPFSITTDSVIWNIGTLAPFQTGSILVTVNVNAGTPIGTLINSGVRIEPVAGDANPTCNTSYWEAYSGGSYDPNDILVDKDTLTTTQLAAAPYLEYIIRFQNTGNDTCFNAKILNPIDTFKLQLNTLEFVASSQPVNMNWIPWERNMELKFDNILLPDSNVNEPMSHGFVRYRIKPKTTLVAGDEIQNTAYIYFDFNQPVQTNTAVTEIVLPTGSPTLTLPSGEGIALAPNPVMNELYIFLKPPLRGGLVGLDIFDLYGREVFFKQYQTTSNQFQTTINVSGFSNGIYFLEINSGEGAYRAKFVKQ